MSDNPNTPKDEIDWWLLMPVEERPKPKRSWKKNIGLFLIMIGLCAIAGFSLGLIIQNQYR